MRFYVSPGRGAGYRAPARQASEPDHLKGMNVHLHKTSWLVLLVAAFGARVAPADSYPKAPSFSVAGVPFPINLAVGDVNGDGKPDLLLASMVRMPGPTEQYDPARSKVLILYQKEGAFKLPADQEIALASPHGMAVGDFDGDGKPDLALSPYGTFDLRLGKEELKTPHLCPTPNGGAGLVVALKLSKEGLYDFLSGPVWRKWEGGDRWQQGYILGPDVNDNKSVLPTDLDMDGQPDLVLLPTTGQDVRLYYGPFLSMRVVADELSKFVTLAPPEPVTAVAVGDLNGDGRPDVVASTGFGPDAAKRKIFIWYQNAPIDFAKKAAPSATIAGVCGSVDIADVNKDGLADLIVAEAGDTKVHIFLQKKDKPFAATLKEADETINVGGNHRLVVADLNGDGYPDLLHDDAATIRVFLNQGAGAR